MWDEYCSAATHVCVCGGGYTYGVRGYGIGECYSVLRIVFVMQISIIIKYYLSLAIAMPPKQAPSFLAVSLGLSEPAASSKQAHRLGSTNQEEPGH